MILADHSQFHGCRMSIVCFYTDCCTAPAAGSDPAGFGYPGNSRTGGAEGDPAAGRT